MEGGMNSARTREGVNNCYDDNRSGKSFTFTGADRQEKGLVFRCAEDLLGACAEQSISGIGMSVFCVFDNEIFDMLAG